MTDEIDLSLAIPCYKEESHLRESVAELVAVLDNTRYNYEILFVEDCSPDSTREILEEVCKKHSRCRWIGHEVNRGRGAAFKTGFEQTTGRVTGFIDIDLEVHARYIPALVEMIDRQEYDVVTGYRHYLLRQTGGFHRHILSVAYRIVCYVLLGLGVKDSETGCKFFKRTTAAKAVLGSESNGWFWDTEVMARASLLGLKIYELPVLFLRRYDKQSTVRLIPDIMDYIVEMYRFRPKVGLSLFGRSPIYWSGKGYDLVIRLLLGAECDRMYKDVAEQIPNDASVLDVCAGSCRLYDLFLRDKNCNYCAADVNGHFVMSARNRGIQSTYLNVLTDELPEADYVVLCGSLYQFHESADLLFEKLYAATKYRLIISEPVRNLADHPVKLIAWCAKTLSRPGEGDSQYRYNPQSFREFAERHGVTEFIEDTERRSAVAIFDKSAVK